MRLPGQLAAEYAVRGIVFALFAAAFLLVAGFAAVQTVRLEGFKLWPFEKEGALATIDRLEAQLTAIGAAQEEAGRLAKQEREANEAEFRTIAETIDSEADDAMASGMADADRYIAANRVRWHWPEGVQRACPGATAGSDATGNPEGTGEAPQLDAGGSVRVSRREGMVLVSEADIRICTENTVKAEAGHAFATQVAVASKRR